MAALELPPGIRLTPQRRTLLQLVAEWQGSFTVADLYERARKAEPGLGLATTYRTVELLRASGAIHPLLGDRAHAYVRCGPDHHHHLVCTSCGGVEETALCAAPEPEELRRLHGFRPTGHELDIYGTCGRCA
jgi:Fur family transcriptional regulator, ferric uptake regulator